MVKVNVKFRFMSLLLSAAEQQFGLISCVPSAWDRVKDEMASPSKANRSKLRAVFSVTSHTVTSPVSRFLFYKFQRAKPLRDMKGVAHRSLPGNLMASR
jgi:hypothetical protein